MGSSGRGPYLYNAFGLLTSRQVTGGVPASAIHMIYDRDGNLLAEADPTTGLSMREYIWLQGRPIAAITDADTASPILYHVHVDQLDRPVLMTGIYHGVVWRASYRPFGEVQSITGQASLDLRFPGQWFVLEAGLNWNWRRWYDPSLGRYTQPDPLGMPDGPSRYAYALGSPVMYTDREGERSAPYPISPIPFPLPPITVPGTPENRVWTGWATNQCRNLGAYLGSLFLPKSAEEGCDEEWQEARGLCARELAKPNPSRRVTGGYDDVEECAKGHVSERCGGNPVDWGSW